MGYTQFHQTLLAGKWTIEISDFPIKTSILDWIFQHAMFDYWTVSNVAMGHPYDR